MLADTLYTHSTLGECSALWDERERVAWALVLDLVHVTLNKQFPMCAGHCSYTPQNELTPKGCQFTERIGQL